MNLKFLAGFYGVRTQCNKDGYLNLNFIVSMSSGLSKDKQSRKYNGISVLIVEDDSIQSYVLKAMVRNLNYKVLGIARSGEKAIQMVSEMNPDIIIMDITLEGEMDGIAAAIKIQESSGAHLIYITGNSEKHYINKANNTSYVDYLVKPIHQEILNKALNKCSELIDKGHE